MAVGFHGKPGASIVTVKDASLTASPAAPVVILGGGLTGISTAVHLRAPWVLFEREDRLGGHARTDERDGYKFDKTGHWLHLRDAGVKQLVEEILPGQMAPIARRARIFSNGVLTRFPFQANLNGLPPEVIKECLMGVIEAKVSGAGAAATDPKNFEEYCLRHFGAGISKHFMIPYNAKLWGVHPREITAAWCSRFVPMPNLEQIVAGAVGAGPPELGYNVSFLYPKAGGIETFTRALQTRMRVQSGQVHTRTSPDVIDWRRREVVAGGERAPYRALVASIPLPELLKRMPDLPPEIAEHASRLRCTTLRYINLASRAKPPADWHWIYVPETKYPFYRVNVFSSAMSTMAPEGAASICVEMADRGPIGEDALRDSVQALVHAGALTSANDVVFAERKEIEYAYVVFDDNYYAATRAIFGFLEQNAIYPRGRYGAWTYNAMEDCVLAGREVAALIDSQQEARA
jgi:protoporphyrinogen oxidase